MTEHHEPKEDSTMTDAAATQPTDDEQPGADVVPIHGTDVERATGRMAIGGMEIDRDLLARTIAVDLNDNELDLFIAVCNRTGLDPFAKQIYAIKRNDRNAPGGKKMGVQTSIDGFRLIAERSGRYAGQVPIEWCGPDKVWTDVWLDKEPPVAARAGVYKAGFAEVLRRTATWDQYVQTTGGNNPEPTRMWKQMPALMLGKCAEALALRAAFPAELSGLYTDDEMSQAQTEYVGARGGQSAIAASSTEPRDPDDIADSEIAVDAFLRIAALPEDLRDELRTTWGNVDRLKGVTLKALPLRAVGVVQSILRGVETKAAKVDGWVAQEQYERVRADFARCVVAAIAAVFGQPLSDDLAASPARDGSETGDEPSDPAPQRDIDQEPPVDETDEQRAERARAVAAEAGLTSVSSLLGDGFDVVAVDEGHVYPLAAPPPIDADDRAVLDWASDAQTAAVIEYVKGLANPVVNKALRAHGALGSGVAENVRRQRLVLGILREIQRQSTPAE